MFFNCLTPVTQPPQYGPLSTTGQSTRAPQSRCSIYCVYTHRRICAPQHRSTQLHTRLGEPDVCVRGPARWPSGRGTASGTTSVWYATHCRTPSQASRKPPIEAVQPVEAARGATAQSGFGGCLGRPSMFRWETRRRRRRGAGGWRRWQANSQGRGLMEAGKAVEEVDEGSGRRHSRSLLECSVFWSW